MPGPEGRSLIRMIWTNFKRSFAPLKREGNLIGRDYFGNKYFEKPARPEIGKRRPERWFEPSENMDENFDKELTAEWESWLRHRRLDPPTDAELKRNLAIMQMKKTNAAELDMKYSEGKETLPQQQVTGGGDFPQYDFYEKVPGKKPGEK